MKRCSQNDYSKTFRTFRTWRMNDLIRSFNQKNVATSAFSVAVNQKLDCSHISIYKFCFCSILKLLCEWWICFFDIIRNRLKGILTDNIKQNIGLMSQSEKMWKSELFVVLKLNRTIWKENSAKNMELLLQLA